jgi:protein gp37
MWDCALAPFGTGPLGTIRPDGGVTRPHTGIDWLIVGDESGHDRRPAQPDWIRTAREAALAHGVAFHFKQWNGPEIGGITGRAEGSGVRRKIHLPLLDGRRWAGMPR